jgi:hypothetical protein
VERRAAELRNPLTLMKLNCTTATKVSFEKPLRPKTLLSTLVRSKVGGRVGALVGVFVGGAVGVSVGASVGASVGV